MQIHTKYYNLASNSYLQNCDLINKYSVKSVFNLPRLRSLVLHFNLKDFTRNCSNTSITAEVQAYTLFFLFCSLSPHLTFNLSTLNQNVSKSESGDFIFKVIVRGDKHIERFIRQVSLENLNIFKENKGFSNKSGCSFCCNSSLSSNSFFDLEDFSKKQNDYNLDLESFAIKISIVFDNLQYCQKKNTLLYNFHPFWNSNLRLNVS